MPLAKGSNQALSRETEGEAERLGARLPKDFLLGAATSAFQIEGSPEADGKGPSIWDRFAARKGAIAGACRSTSACEHYRLWREDLALMAGLGLEAYRFSVSWPRIQPQGRGPVNAAGLGFYDRLVDGLLEAGIEPFLTLYHWDLPQALQSRGGWAVPATGDRFAEYSGLVARALGDRVRHFSTLNEPWMFTFIGNFLGLHAPGRHNPWHSMRVLHGALLGHAKALAALRAEAPGAELGISLSLSPIEPATSSEADGLAAGRADLFMNRLLLDPILRGSYPEEALAMLHLFWPRMKSRDLDLLASSRPDFLGVNTYTRERARYAKDVPIFHFWTELGDPPETDFVKDGVQYTDMGYETYPRALGLVLERLRDDYGNPRVYVTENGASFADKVEGGRVHDPKREAWIQGYLAEAQRAEASGCRLKGFFYWSLLDNLEWAFGYGKRHGLIHVDFDTQVRTVKDSGRLYARIIAGHRSGGRA